MNRTSIAAHVGQIDFLLGIVDAVKNHQEVIKAGEEALSLLKRTDEEIQKAQELKELTELNKSQIEELEKLKSSTKNERIRLEAEKEEITRKRAELSDLSLRLQKEKEANERAAAKNEEIKKLQEGHAQFISDQKAANLAEKQKLDEREKALDIRAEKILLREKAADL